MFRIMTPVSFLFITFGMLRAGEPLNQPDITYAKADAVELKLDFARPSGDGPYPLVVCIHGGGWAFGSRTEYKELQKNLAKLGYASAAVQYRLAPKNRFPAQLDDINAAVSFLMAEQKKYHLDSKRVAFLGGSAGGHLSLLAGMHDDSKRTVRAIVNFAGPTDMRTFKANTTGDKALNDAIKKTSTDLLNDLLGTMDREADIYQAASPITKISKHTPPILTIHGTADDIVPFSQAEALHTALKKAALKELLLPIEGGNHDVNGWPEAARVKAFMAALDFLKEHLQTPPK